jgi:hypothetical protein
VSRRGSLGLASGATAFTFWDRKARGLPAAEQYVDRVAAERIADRAPPRPPILVDAQTNVWWRAGGLNRKNGMLRSLGLGLLLGAGLGSVAWAQSSAKFDGQYVGELTLTKVINDCTQPPLGALYPLTISRGEVRFKYVPRFNTTLTGKVTEDGMFKASARLRRGSVQMTGHIQGNNLTAHIVSPSCNYTFQTKN